MKFSDIRKKYFKSTEEIVSMFLGLIIVVVVGGLIFSYFQKNKGNINIPGSSDISLSDKSDGDRSDFYEVELGDSLWKIAEKKYNNGYAWTEIAKANNIKNPSVIEVGQKIVLPEVEVTEKIEVDKILVGSEYKVVRGDSLWKIAVRAYGDGYQWVKIWEENKSKIYNPNGLEIGMMISIPQIN
ncbi:MAG TPA: LysM peptidoglycan-binding domain-containing protein [Candidatus Woesebacteria bacterium]|jgi:LysM repeat protein|nr:LysM peptidoglycan-binding domain-containing protein [Candidatus Shapirobacteria bacterium]HOR01700.1 LysM peptidoglycan-binding domain-containing protein [Candidatus Woesebacteria bacterium]